ncbi:MAG: UDP-glucose/GDP-mannose dehydrogenase family protein [Gammaproteobacteria bacterium]|nr:UDP-glucose/GDP-mannose dehydrogenase family protein [Gammaproteobacteria bacterium]
MNITVVGAGYVGLVTGACLADMGNQVLCVDNDPAKIAELNAGRPPFFEPGLEELLGKTAAAGLRFTADIAAGVAHGEVIFIAVGTPPGDDGGADLRHVLAVAKSIGEHLDIDGGDGRAGDGGDRGGANYRVVVNKSTAPVGTAQRVEAVIFDALKSRGWRPAGDGEGNGDNTDTGNAEFPANSAPFSVVANPEFLKQGGAIDDFMKPDRIIIGSVDARALAVMRELYAPFNRNHERIIAMDLASAELTKYAANAMLAARISTMNEMANIAEKLGADIEAVRRGVGADPRIGYAYIYPGCGYGGSCLPKDLRALRQTAAAAGVEARLLAAVEAVNAAQKRQIVARLDAHFGDLSGRRFALWGLAFKPDTDDMRAAPSRAVVEELWARGALVRAFDPAATGQARRLYAQQVERGELELLSADPFEALAGADALIVVTEWRMFRAAEPARIAAALGGEVVVDGRNLYDPEAFRAAGLIYYGIGR